MQSENFDKKIKDLLDLPPESETNPAWDNMEKMLDKHLPQKKDDNRRYILWLLIFLLVGGAAFITWRYAGSNKNEIASANNTEQNSELKTADGKETSSSTKENISANPNGPTTNNENSLTENNIVSDDKKPESNKVNDLSGIKTNQNNSETEITVSDAGTSQKKVSKKQNPPGQETAKKKTNTPDKNQTIVKKDEDKSDQLIEMGNDDTEPTKNVQDITKTKDENADVAANTDQKSFEKTETKTDSVISVTPVASVNTKTKNNKTKGSFFNNIFFTVSAGADVSTVGINKAGRMQIVTGAGIGYQVSKKFSVRTGFYTTNKIYTAGPEDYNPPANFWNYYPNLKTIDADCKVYEIPLMVDYSISDRKKSSWFVSGGVSTLLMKKEKYDYYFKPNTSPNYITYSRTINNQNKHYFSILDLSGGYRRQINRNLSIQAEPYFKIALSGVGYGKVKLNSGGVLVSAIIKPFARK